MTTILVEIPSCAVEQLVKEKTIPLASGRLSVLQSLDNESLTLTVGDMAFPLKEGSPVYTHAENSRWYFFGMPETDGSFVKVTLPEATVGSLDEKLRDQFEEVLIKKGMLQSGLAAAGDEIGASAKAEASTLAALIKSQVNNHVGSHPPTTEPITVSSTAHSIADGAASATETAANYSSKAAQAFASVTIGIGEKVVELLGGKEEGSMANNDVQQKLHSDLTEAGYEVDGGAPPVPPKDVHAGADAWEGTKNAAAGIGEGAGILGEAVVTGGQTVINHDYGKDASAITNKAGEAAGNVGNVVKDLTVNSSVLVHGAREAVKPADPDGPVYTV